MEKKGFTLFEMVATVAVLGMIFVVVFPNVINLLEKSIGIDYDRYKSDVVLAAEAYVEMENIHVGDSKKIQCEEIVKSGYLGINEINPNNNKKVTESECYVNIKKSTEDGISYYDYIYGGD